MISRISANGFRRTIVGCRNFSEKEPDKSNIRLPEPENPFKRTGRILKNDLKNFKNFLMPPKKLTTNNSRIETFNKEVIENFQTHCDILVIGGNAVGSSIAYWLKKQARKGLHVVVVDKPNQYTAPPSFTVDVLTNQFALEENVLMSLYGGEFFRNINQQFESDSINVNFVPSSYLVLSPEKDAEILQKKSKMQNELGANNEILTLKKLKDKFPWLNIDGIALGCLGREMSGLFDSYALTDGFRKTAIKFGAHYEIGEILGFQFSAHPDLVMRGIEPGSYESIDKVIIRLPNGEDRTIKFAICIIADEFKSGEVAKLARIGKGKGLLGLPIPFETNHYNKYLFECLDNSGPGLNLPIIDDPMKLYLYRNGLAGEYIACHQSNNSDLDAFFESNLRDIISNRCSKFRNIHLKDVWSETRECNSYDESGIIGPHPYYHNLYITAGFGRHSIQNTPAIGRAISELIIDGGFISIDLTRLSFDRLIVDQPMHDIN